MKTSRFAFVVLFLIWAGMMAFIWIHYINRHTESDCPAFELPAFPTMIRELPHRRPVQGVHLTSDGKLFCSCGVEGDIHFGSVAPESTNESLASFQEELTTARISSSGRFVAAAGATGVIRVWDTTSRDCVLSFSLPRPDEQIQRVTQVAFSSNELALAVSASGGFVHLIDLVKRTETGRLPGRGGPIMSVTYSRDGDLVAMGNWDGSVQVYDVRKGKQKREFMAHPSELIWGIDFIDHLGGLATCGGKTIRVWDPFKNECVLELEGHTENVLSIATTTDGRFLLSGSFDETVRLWNLENGQEMLKFRAHGGPVYCVSLSADGSVAASAGRDCKARLWSLKQYSDTKIPE